MLLSLTFSASNVRILLAFSATDYSGGFMIEISYFRVSKVMRHCVWYLLLCRLTPVALSDCQWPFFVP